MARFVRINEVMPEGSGERDGLVVINLDTVSSVWRNDEGELEVRMIGREKVVLGERVAYLLLKVIESSDGYIELAV